MKSSSTVTFNQGRALCKIAGEYPTLFEVIMEAVQNAIDADATSVNIILNRKGRNITIADNGNGVTQDDFEVALGKVCESVKERGKLGQFGIGLISPLGKCTRFTFTSCAKDSDEGYIEWTFETEAVRAQAETVKVPHRKRTDLIHKSLAAKGARPGLTPVDWRTMVSIYSYTKDRVINRINDAQSLADGIAERYGSAMRRNDVQVGIYIRNEDGTENMATARAKRFAGKLLKEVIISNRDAGDTTFTMYLARKSEKGYRGKVVVGEADNEFRISFAAFARAADLLPGEVVDALSSGIFEGEILTQKAKLHANRKGFLENEALMGMCEAVEAWFKEGGKKHYQAAQEQREDQRYQELGLESMRSIEALLRNSKFAPVLDVIGSFKRGSIGNGHQLTTSTKVLGKQPEKSVAVNGTNGDGHDGSQDKSRDPADSLANHHPFTVAGPQGRRRTTVRSDSLGLQFSHTVMEGSDKLYELDLQNGVLHFNIRHPTWVQCEKSDRQIKQLQEFITIQALVRELMPEDWRKTTDLFVDEVLNPFAFLIQNSPSFSFRRTAV